MQQEKAGMQGNDAGATRVSSVAMGIKSVGVRHDGGVDDVVQGLLYHRRTRRLVGQLGSVAEGGGGQKVVAAPTQRETCGLQLLPSGICIGVDGGCPAARLADKLTHLRGIRGVTRDGGWTEQLGPAGGGAAITVKKRAYKRLSPLPSPLQHPVREDGAGCLLRNVKGVGNCAVRPMIGIVRKLSHLPPGNNGHVYCDGLCVCVGWWGRRRGRGGRQMWWVGWAERVSSMERVWNVGSKCEWVVVLRVCLYVCVCLFVFFGGRGSALCLPSVILTKSQNSPAATADRSMGESGFREVPSEALRCATVSRSSWKKRCLKQYDCRSTRPLLSCL